MSRDNSARTGVTNHLGQVFKTRNSSETHSGLIVVDGSVIPAALGVNPLATIAALAERAVEEYITQSGGVSSQDANKMLDLMHGVPAHIPRAYCSSSHPDSQAANTLPGTDRQYGNDVFSPDVALKRTLQHPNNVSFAECMSGFILQGATISCDGVDGFERATRFAKCRGETAQLFINVSASDMSISGQYEGWATGSLVCAGINGSPFMIRRGSVELFKPDVDITGRSKIIYNFPMVGVNGRRLRLYGYKVLDSSVVFNIKRLWHALTTMYVTIAEDTAHECQVFALAASSNLNLEGFDHRGVVAAGIVRITASHLFKELRSLTPAGHSFVEKARVLRSFLTFFVSHSARPFLSPIRSLQYASQEFAQDYINPTLPTRSHEVIASDGVRSLMHEWEPSAGEVAVNSSGGDVDVENLLMIPGASVDHQIFASPTIPFNAVNYFTRAGYRVFVIVHRIGISETNRAEGWTTFDARLDIRACLKHIRMSSLRKKTYIVAHCMGSVALASGLLDGTIPSEWILGVTCSQVFMNPVWSRVNNTKRASPISLLNLQARVVGKWFDCRASADAGPAQKFLDQALRFYPERIHERCRSASCHRTTLLYGRCWNHANLNPETHRHIDKFFTGAHLRLMKLLTGMSGAVTTNAPDRVDLTTAGNLERLRGIPFLFFCGGDNDVLSPAATERTYDKLIHTFGFSADHPDGGLQYRRKVISRYGHLDCWIGRNAWRDVFPVVREEVDRVVRGEDYVFRQPRDKYARMIESTRAE